MKYALDEDNFAGTLLIDLYVTWYINCQNECLWS